MNDAPDQVIKFLEQTHAHLNQNINLADQKASILLTADIAFLGLFANLIESNWGSSTEIFKIGSLVTIIAAVIGIVLAGWTVYPRTPKESGSLMYFGAISGRSLDQYQHELADLNKELALEELVNENHNLSIVAANKFQNFRRGLLATAVMIVFAIISGVAIVS